MANIMSQVNLKNHVHRNGFDLSHRNLFTAKVGQILPIFCKEVLPGDTFKIDLNSFTRTLPVDTAAYTRIQEYYDFYFVPTSLMWDKFPNFIVQTNNYSHARAWQTNPDNMAQHPYINTDDLFGYLKYLKTSNQYDYLGFSRYENACRLLTYLDYGDWRHIIENTVGSTDYPSNVALNPFPLMAYQKVCQDYFRFQQWEPSLPYLYNTDYIFRSNDLKLPLTSLRPTTPEEVNMFDLCYCNYKKDLITGLLPTSQFGDVSIIGPLMGYQRMTAGKVNPVNGDMKNGFIADFSSYTGNHPLDLLGRSGLGVSVFALRFGEASQRWKEITNSGNLDYKEQIQKHWNVSVSNDQSYRCRWLGGRSGNIVINEVVNNNLASGNSALIAGKGVNSVNGHVLKSSFNEYGYIIGVYHAAPVLDWTASGVARQNLKIKATDYAIPEFDSLGMEEVPFIQVSAYLKNHNGAWAKTLGYAPRYWDYKTSQDKVRGAFIKSLKSWVAPRNSDDFLFDFYPFTWQSFKVSPSSVDSIFLSEAAADDTVDSDQLLISAYFDCHAVRNLSVHGLPY